MSTSASSATTAARSSNRVAAGERLTVTRAGKPVAEFRPMGQPALTADVLLERWRHLPHVDAEQLREDLDELLDPAP